MLRQRFCRHRPQPEILLQIFDRADSVEEVGSISSRHFQNLVLVDLLPDHVLTRRVFITGVRNRQFGPRLSTRNRWEPSLSSDGTSFHCAKSPTISTAAPASRTHIFALKSLVIVATYSVSDVF